MCRGFEADSLLTLWERTLGVAAWARDDALLRAASQGMDPPRTLGERNARLLGLHGRLFGRELELLSHCPVCGTAVQFTSDSETLAAQMSPRDHAPSHRLESQGHLIEFRLPENADVVAASSEVAEDDFVRHVLDRCVIDCTCDGATVRVRDFPPPVLDALSQRMEALDPGVSVSFALECPECAARWDAPLDVARLVWPKVQAAAECLLLEVDALARAYGWTEQDVLRLSPTRRAAYLQMVTA